MNNFLDELSKALKGNIPESSVQSHIDYYRQYIIGEKAKGRSEEDVLAQLGDPRLIAKNIIDTSPVKNKNNKNAHYEEFDREESKREKKKKAEKESKYDKYFRKRKQRIERGRKIIRFLDKASSTTIGKILLVIVGIPLLVALAWIAVKVLKLALAIILPLILIIIVLEIIFAIIRK